MPQVQQRRASIINVITFFITVLCDSQVYAMCTYSSSTESEDSTSCTPFSTSTIIGIAIGGIILLTIIGIIGRIRRRRLQQRAAQTTFVYGTPRNTYARPQTNIYRPYPSQSQCRPIPSQMHSLNRQAMTAAPSFPQPSHPSPMTHSAHTRSPTYSNQTPHVSPPSSPNSTRLPPPGSPSRPSTYSRVSADSSTIQTPSISVTPASYTYPHATPVGRPSPAENMQMIVNAEVANDEPPPAYTPV
ncbi:hypothetical protein BDR04DRAFT_1101007 [Suillus decipiens]|nr:hypothetical protein BDR04DRAFT_1101007 [Suillus decipiens]